MATHQIPELGTPEADCYFFDDYVSAEGPAVAHLYPDADFVEIYAKAEERIFEVWTAEDFARVALARELERLRTGDDAQFGDLFERVQAPLRAAVVEGGPHGTEESHQAYSKLRGIKGRRTTILIHGWNIVPPHRLEEHEDGVARSILNKALRDRIDILRAWELVHQGTNWAVYLPESGGGPYAMQMYPVLVQTAARLMPEDWEDLLEEVDESKASDLESLITPSASDTIMHPASIHEAPTYRARSETKQEGRNVNDDSQSRSIKSEGGSNVTTRMVELAVNECRLFHDGKRGFGVFEVEGHRECLPIQSSAFRTRITTQIYASEGKIPNGTAIADARNMIEGLALAEGEFIKPAIRVAGTRDEIFIDLGDAEWRCVRVVAGGWSVLPHPDEVFFIRPADFGELPEPRHGRDFDALREFVNLKEDQLRLFQTFLLSACHPQGPYVQLVSSGVPGATKSSLQKLAKALLDPTRRPANSSAPVSLSRKSSKSGDLFVAASHSHLVTADNVSHISNEQSDEYCSLATGGSWKTRQYYTNFGEASIDVCRPVLINGISNPVRRSDHGERAILIETTKPRKVIDEDDYWRLFENAWPELLGALYDALAIVIRLRYAVSLPYSPRMVNFPRVGMAASQGLGWEVDLPAIYRKNQQQIMAEITDGEPIIAMIVSFARNQRDWRGSPSDLVDAIKESRSLIDLPNDRRGWPDSGKAMAEVLKRNKDVLEQEGVTWDYVPSNIRKIWLHGEVSVSQSPAAV